MYNGKKNFFKGDTGSVMMETVLVLPLYIAFFSGIFLIGDLQVCAGRLYSADRTVVTHNSNRYVSKTLSKDNLSQLVFKGSGKSLAYGDQTKIKSISVSSVNCEWSQIAVGNSDLTFTLPSWTIGWQKAVNHIWGNKKANSKDKSTVSLDGYYVFMRRKDDSREDKNGGTYGRGLKWYSTYGKPFLPGTALAGLSGVSSMGDYNRFSQYVLWSDR